MRPRCPVCDSIQTKLQSNKNILALLNIYTCKNCGHEFVLAPEKPKGCLWSLMKIIFGCLALLIVLLWIFKEDILKENIEIRDSSLPLSQTVEQVLPVTETKQSASIEESQNMEDTLSIRTEVRNSH